MLVENLSSALCMYAIIDIMLDARLAFYGVPEELDKHEVRVTENLRFQDSKHNVAFSTFQRKWNSNSPNLVPLFKGSSFFLAAKTCGLGFNPNLKQLPHFISWRCRAPEMRETRGHIALWLDCDKLHVESFDWE